MKIPLLNEIYPFDNSVNPYSSISGHTFENWYSEKPDLNSSCPRNLRHFGNPKK